MIMRHPLRRPDTARQIASAPREGFVLVAVLLVVVVLALAAYQFSESMAAEYAASDSYARVGQARAIAKSAIDYSMVMLSNPDTFASTLGGNPIDNPTAFQHIIVQDSDKPRFRGAFDIVAPYDYDSIQAGMTSYRYGVIDESSKININALFKLDSSGQTLINFLMTLPNMTEDVANSIADWIDPDDDTRDNGAESDYYSGLSPAYQAKNGPLDSIEELLLVKGVTPQLLFGNDQNRNGMLDPGEADGAALDLGWSAFITVFSREQNVSSKNIARINVNSSDLSALIDQLSSAVGEDMAVYIVGYRLFSGGGGSSGSSSGSSSGTGSGGGATGGAGGPIAGGGGGRAGGMAATGGAAAGGRAGGGGAGGTGAGGAGAGAAGGGRAAAMSAGAAGGGSQASMGVNRMTMATGQGGMSLSQMSMNGKTITMTATASGAGGGSSGGGGSTGGTINASGPMTRAQLGDLTNPSTQPTSISSLYGLINSTVTVPGQNGQPSTVYSSPLNNKDSLASTLPLMLDQLTTQGTSEIPARLNINTASQVLLAGLPGLTPADVETIVSQRPDYTGGASADPLYATPAWLVTQANFPASTMQGLDRYITASTQVFRVQGLGYFDGGGPTARVEAVVDTNAGRPRLMYWRDLTELGKGYTPQPVQ
jgi:type II secretory pathway component PulK